MTGRAPHISLADLAAAGIRLRATEAATIARELTLRAAAGALPGIPSPHVIRLTEDGAVHVEGPVASGLDVARAARLLEALLPGFDAPLEFRVPGALRLVVARALGILDLPPYESLDAFVDALARFAAPDGVAALRDVTASWRAAVAAEAGTTSAPAPAAAAGPDDPSPELTISDIRRARRATRLTLAEISERSRIPVDQLRELEWGYLARWPQGFYGRTQVVRYARAAGLDEKVVVRAVLPLLEDWERGREETTALVAVPSATAAVVLEETHLVKVEPSPLVPVKRTPRRRRAAWAAAAGIAAMLAIGALPAWWESTERSEQESAAAPTSAPARPVPAPAARPERVPAEPLPEPSFSPAFASVGSAMFFHSGDGPRSAIMRADTDPKGGVLRVTRVVADGSSNYHARPSPDGASIAFDSDRDGVRGVYVADASGQNVRRVSGAGFAAVPSWSPDGRRLAFVRAEAERPRVWNIWTVDLESGKTARVTDHAVGQPWGAAWFPDGNRIAYSHETRLVIRALDGREQSTFNSPVRGRLLRTPAVSPDGRRIIFQVHRDGAWVLDLVTGRMRKVLADPTAEEFTWSPDASRVAYHSRRSGKWGIRVLSRSASDAD